MTWLGEWLRELILVVLMAAFVEMLLPSKSMERYARLVLSLLVLLTLLSPIVSLLKGDAGAELSLAMEQQQQDGGLLSGAGDGADSLDNILAEGRRLAAGTQEQGLKLAAEEVAGQMREQIAANTGVEGVKVTVTLGMAKTEDREGPEAQPVISSVFVTLPSADVAEEAGGTGPSAEEPIVIKTVEPVQISVGNGAEDMTDSPEASAASGSDPAVEDLTSDASSEELKNEAIMKLLEHNWNLEREVIQIQSQSAAAAKL